MLRKIFSKVTGKTEQQLLNEALRSAAIKDRPRRVKKLLAAGAEVDYKDINGLTPLFFAAGHATREVCHALLEHVADPNAGRDDLLGPGILQAAYGGNLPVLKTFLAFKADINVRNAQERTALHLAIWRGQAETALYLIAAGADPNTQDKYDSRPLEDALAFCPPAVACALVKAGADCAVADRRGRDMRAAAVARELPEVVAAIDDLAAAKSRQARKEQQRKEDLAAAAEKAPVPQNDIAIKKPLVLKPRP